MGMFASLIVKGLRRNVTENVLAKKVRSVGVKVELSLAKLRSNLDWALLLFVFGTLNKGGKVFSVMGILYFMYFIFFWEGGNSFRITVRIKILDIQICYGHTANIIIQQIVAL